MCVYLSGQGAGLIMEKNTYSAHDDEGRATAGTAANGNDTSKTERDQV